MFVSFMINFSWGQCAKPILVTPENVSTITDPYQLTFLHEIPKNYVDSLVYTLLHAKSLIDQQKIVETIAKTGTQEAFLLLWVASIHPLVFEDMNPFGTLCAIIDHSNGPSLLNKYFFKNSVKVLETSDHLTNKYNFKQAILKECAKKKPKAYFCTVRNKALDPDLGDINPRKYDKQIIKIINRNSNTQNPQCIKNIIKEVTELPFVEDVLWDGCYEKLCIYPAYYQLMVIMNIDNKKVERYYSMKGAKFVYFGIRWKGEGLLGRTIETNKNKLVVVNTGYSPGSIDAARAYCETKKNQN